MIIAEKLDLIYKNQVEIIKKETNYQVERKLKIKILKL